MNKQQLTDLVIIPTLKEIPSGYSPEAVMAIQMIIAHESSGGEYLAQTNGPALGIIQMEPATHDDVWRWGDSVIRNAKLLGFIPNDDEGFTFFPDATRLIWDLRYNVSMARQKLFMDDGALPNNPENMAVYLKKHWNGYGKATADKYYNDFIGWV